MRPIRALVLYASSTENATLSYQQGWPRALVEHPRLDCVAVNLADRRRLGGLWLPRRLDAVVLLHSVFSNFCHLRGRVFERVARLRTKKVFFIGNEYKLMPEKIAFCERLGVDLLVSQLSSPDAHRLYRERLGCAVVGIPNTGFDPDLFHPQTPYDERPIDLGYRGYRNPFYLGHDERAQLVEAFVAAGGRRGLALDVSLDAGDRFTQEEWAAFLGGCRGQLGSEAGGDYFELTDETRIRVNAYLEERPNASFAEVYDRFFRDYPERVSGRCLSGRVVEAAATKTVQLLLEGHYDEGLEPDVHYIPVRKDLSNIDDALAKFTDVPYACQISEHAYELALERWTYPRLVDRFAEALAPLVER